MKKIVVKTSKNIKDTKKIARFFVSKILKNKNKKALVVGLSGELGTGKTVFVRAVGGLLGIKRNINSPTFVIMKKYPMKDRYKYFFHLDAYRLKNEHELLQLGWREIVENKEHLVFIEWPENVAKIIPRNSHFIRISHNKKRYRTFKIQHNRRA